MTQPDPKPQGFLKRVFESSSRFISGVDARIGIIGNRIADKYDEHRNPANFLYRAAELYLLSMAAGIARAPALAAREGSRIFSKALRKPLNDLRSLPAPRPHRCTPSNPSRRASASKPSSGASKSNLKKGTKAMTAPLRIGDLDDGGIYVGKSATTGKDLHAALADEQFHMTLDMAFIAAAAMSKLPGRENAHVPTPEELNDNLYRNKDRGHLSGTFNTSVCDGDSSPDSCYLAVSYNGNNKYPYAHAQWFDTGAQSGCNRNDPVSVRLVW